jgi:hypothetical protein
MNRGLIICLSILVWGCADQNEVRTAAVKPEGVPACDISLAYPGYRGGAVEIEGVVSGGVGAFHVNDLMYLMMGPMAEEKMVIFQVDLENSGSERISLDRTSLTIHGGDGVVISSIPPDAILTMSRGTDASPDPDDVYQQLGDGLVGNGFSKGIDIGPGEQGSMMIAFPLPLPPDPRIIVSVAGKSATIPICWGE